jgi:hypothetical protein
MVDVKIPEGNWKVQDKIRNNSNCIYLCWPGADTGCQITKELCTKESCPLRIKEE